MAYKFTEVRSQPRKNPARGLSGTCNRVNCLSSQPASLPSDNAVIMTINYLNDYFSFKRTLPISSVVGNIGEILDSIRFLNGPSTVTSDMKFTFLRQCALYVEPENFTKTMHGWVTPRYTPVKYLYQAPDGISPPLGIRSAVPLGGMGTGMKIDLADRRCQGPISKRLYFPYWSLESAFSRVQNSSF